MPILTARLDPLEARSFEARLASRARACRRDRGVPSAAVGAPFRSCRGSSPGLKRRIMSSPALRPPRHIPAWGSLAASFLAGAVLAGSITLGALHRQAGDEIASEVVSAHIRGLMAPMPTDVPSSDHHTIKPWFNGKLAFAPVVPDLGTEGFPLVGARVDVVGLEPAATLVYSRGKHLISLTAIPAGKEAAAPPRSHEERGFLARTWTQGGVTYFAVSDAAVEELEAFVKLFRAEVARNG